jgi:hypothetical protein
MPRSPMQWRDQSQDLLWVLWIIVRCAIVAGVILVCGRGLELVSGWLFKGGTTNWSVGVVRVLSDLFAIVTFLCLAIRDIWVYFFEP